VRQVTLQRDGPVVQSAGPVYDYHVKVWLESRLVAIMHGHSKTPARLSPAAPTLDSVPNGQPSGQMSNDLSIPHGCHFAAPIVEGSGPELTSETHALLRIRLRAAALLLFVGFAVFLLKHFFQSDFSIPGDVFFFALHLGTTIVLGVLTGLLCDRCQIPLKWLRIAELVVFGLPVVLFAAGQHLWMLRCCEQGYCVFRGGPWIVLMFTYALFIPNTWQRAAVATGLIFAAPILLIIELFTFHPEVARLMSADQLGQSVLVLLTTAAGCVYGVHTIGTLRREAFEARQLGQYRLKERIGAGGMGEVYLAEHQLLKRPCVVKLIRPDKAGDEKTLARFQREVRATAKLSHWNTVEIFDYGSTEEGTFYYVMEYLPGMSLAEIVDRSGPMPAPRVVYLLRQVCNALTEAHGAGLIHRDIKPGNVFAAYRGGLHDVAKLLDFGLVKTVADDEVVIQLTTEGSVTGSPLFMSPEQATGDSEPDARSDIYSLGAVAYYLLTARPPFEGTKPIKVMISHAHHEVVPPSKHAPGIPADLEQVVLRCLAKDPADRPKDAASLEKDLGECEAAAGWSAQHACRWWEEHGIRPGV